MGVPTDIIDAGGPYIDNSLLVNGTVFTDPYGVAHTSPTPVLVVSYATYVTHEPTMGSDGKYEECEEPLLHENEDVVKPYPSGN